METLRSEKAPYTDTTYLPELPKKSENSIKKQNEWLINSQKKYMIYLYVTLI